MVNKVAAARAVMKGKMRQDGNLKLWHLSTHQKAILSEPRMCPMTK